MDINCIEKCEHQREGKCTLLEVTSYQGESRAPNVSCSNWI